MTTHYRSRKMHKCGGSAGRPSSAEKRFSPRSRSPFVETLVSSKHKPWQNTTQDTTQNSSKTQAQTLKHNVVSGHKSLGRPASQTPNPTKLNQTHPTHTNTQPKHTKTQCLGAPDPPQGGLLPFDAALQFSEISRPAPSPTAKELAPTRIVSA